MVPTVDTATGTSVTPAVVTATPADPVVAAEPASVAPAPTSFGVNASGGVLTVDSGAGLLFKVNQTNGNITSIRYKDGAEMQYWEKGSHIASGLGSSTVVTYAVNGRVAKVTLSTPTLTHYLLVRQGENTIYMGTFTTAEPDVGELRWITRLNSDVLTSTQPASNLPATPA